MAIAMAIAADGSHMTAIWQAIAIKGAVAAPKHIHKLTHMAAIWQFSWQMAKIRWQPYGSHMAIKW